MTAVVGNRHFCWRCKGTGVALPEFGGESPCTYCDGERTVYRGEQILAEDFHYAHEILNVTDVTEYLALTVENKDLYHLVLSCGIVDFREGFMARAVLQGLFDPGVTWNNLINL